MHSSSINESITNIPHIHMVQYICIYCYIKACLLCNEHNHKVAGSPSIMKCDMHNSHVTIRYSSYLDCLLPTIYVIVQRFCIGIVIKSLQSAVYKGVSLLWNHSTTFSKMMKTLIVFLVVAVAIATASSYGGYGGYDENRDGLNDR